MPDPNPTRRANYARLLLANATTDQHFIWRWVSRTAWDRRAGVLDDDEHHGLGFLPPYLLGDSWVVMACAEVLVEAAGHLVDADFFGFIDSIVTHQQLHVVAATEGLSGPLAEIAVLAEQRKLTDRDWRTFEDVRSRAIL